MVKRIQLRIMVDLQDGLSKQALLVYRNENAALAARRCPRRLGAVKRP